MRPLLPSANFASFARSTFLPNSRRSASSTPQRLRVPSFSRADLLTLGAAKNNQHAVQQIVRQKPRGQLVLAGYSARGDVAHAALSQLIAAGRDVVLLGVFDTSVSGVAYPEPPAPQRTAFDQMGHLLRRLRWGEWRRLDYRPAASRRAALLALANVTPLGVAALHPSPLRVG
jgi:hypothetical protein